MQNMLSEALALYRKGVKLGDAVLIAWANEIKAEKIWTYYRRDFKKAGFLYEEP